MGENKEINLKRVVPILISVMILVTLFVLQFTLISAKREIDWNVFWSNFIVNSVIIIAVGYAWLTSGVARAKAQDESGYRTNMAKYSEKINHINANGQLRLLTNYCESKTMDIQGKAIAKLLNSVCIDKKTYDNELSVLNAQELAGLKYSNAQIRVIRKVQRGKVRVTKINCMELLTDSKVASDDNTIHYDERLDTSIRTCIRVVKSFISATVFTLLAIELSGSISDISAWAMFLMKALTMVYTAWSSEREGYEQIMSTKSHVILRRLTFISMFEEWLALQPPKVEDI